MEMIWIWLSIYEYVGVSFLLEYLEKNNHKRGRHTERLNDWTTGKKNNKWT